jgi:hypothetical protein
LQGAAESVLEEDACGGELKIAAGASGIEESWQGREPREQLREKKQENYGLKEREEEQYGVSDEFLQVPNEEVTSV